MPEGLPHNPYFLSDLHPTARASAALPAAGAWDTAPTELLSAGMDWIMLILTYTRGAAGGACEFRVEVSPDSSGTRWARASLYDPGILAAGADVDSAVQREEFTYAAIAAGAETFLYGPLHLGGHVERIRIPAHETGVVGTPGTLAVEARLS